MTFNLSVPASIMQFCVRGGGGMGHGEEEGQGAGRARHTGRPFGREDRGASGPQIDPPPHHTTTALMPAHLWLDVSVAELRGVEEGHSLQQLAEIAGRARLVQPPARAVQRLKQVATHNQLPLEGRVGGGGGLIFSPCLVLLRSNGEEQVGGRAAGRLGGWAAHSPPLAHHDAHEAAGLYKPVAQLADTWVAQPAGNLHCPWMGQGGVGGGGGGAGGLLAS